MGRNSTDSNKRNEARRRGAKTGVKRALPHGAELRELLRELDANRAQLATQDEQLRAARRVAARLGDQCKSLYDDAPVGYVTLDDSGVILAANRRAQALLGAPIGELEGAELASFLSDSSVPAFERHLEEVRADGNEEGYEVTLERSGLKPVRVRISSSVMTGAEPGFRSVLIDLTELRRAEESLRAVTACNEAILEKANEAMVRCDFSWRIEATNGNAQKLFGYSEEELVGGDLRELLPGLSSTAPSGLDGSDLVGKRSDGTRFPLALRLGEWKEHGRRKLMAMISDISDRERQQDELRQAHKMEAVGALASGVAHDFNNVLQGVLGCLTVARAPGTTREEADELMGRAAFAAHRGGDLARSLLAFARNDEVEPTQIRIDHLVRATAPLLQRLVTEQVEVVVQLGAPRLRVLAATVQLEQILLNLVVNARDAMPDGGTVTIRTEAIIPDSRSSGSPRGLAGVTHLRLTVEDTGCGMSEGTLKRIFEPFFTTKPPGQGTGLGLSTVFALTREINGRIDVCSEPTRGTRFVLTLPCSVGSATTASAQFPAVRELEGVVLLVEDEALIRLSTRHYLERLGFDVVEARDGGEALETANRLPQIDLLVTDVILPRMMGPALAETLRERLETLPVLFITANPELAEATSLEQASVLAKPFDLSELAEALTALLPETRREPPAPDLSRLFPSSFPVRPLQPADASDGTAILVVEDDTISGPILARLLEGSGYQVTLAATAPAALEAVEARSYSLVLCDMHVPGMGGDLLAIHMRQHDPSLPIVFMSGLDEAPALASGFIQKPIDFDSLVSVIERALPPN